MNSPRTNFVVFSFVDVLFQNDEGAFWKKGQFYFFQDFLLERVKLRIWGYYCLGLDANFFAFRTLLARSKVLTTWQAAILGFSSIRGIWIQINLWEKKFEVFFSDGLVSRNFMKCLKKWSEFLQFEIWWKLQIINLFLCKKKNLIQVSLDKLFFLLFYHEYHTWKDFLNSFVMNDCKNYIKITEISRIDKMSLITKNS